MNVGVRQQGTYKWFRIETQSPYIKILFQQNGSSIIFTKSLPSRSKKFRFPKKSDLDPTCYICLKSATLFLTYQPVLSDWVAFIKRVQLPNTVPNKYLFLELLGIENAILDFLCVPIFLPRHCYLST